MKYIRKFFESVDKITNLSDCLQETFDKYNIPEYTSDDLVLFWRIIEDSIIIRHVGDSNSHEYYEELRAVYYSIQRDIKSAKNLIEKRIGDNISINHGLSGGYWFISIKIDYNP